MAEQQDIAPWPTAKDPGGAKEWTANGRLYSPCPTLSVARYEEYEILGVEGGMDRTFEQVHAKHVRQMELINKLARGQDALGELAVITNDLINGGFAMKEREIHPALKMCALFINRKDEDVTTITEAMIAEKVNDWRIEGISVQYFFVFALHLIPGYIAAYKENSRDTSDQVESEQNPSGKMDSRATLSALHGTVPAPSTNA